MEPLSDPFESSPQKGNHQDPEELPNRALSSEDPFQSTPAAGNQATDFAFDLSSDPLGSATPFQTFNSASAAQQSRNIPNRKRGPSSPIHNPIDKSARTSHPTNSTNANALILEARDLLIQAYSLTGSRDQQARLLDLVEVFREYTEQGRIRHTSTILASQISNLEQATRKIEKQARQAKNQQPTQPEAPQPSTKPTWAKVAIANLQNPQTQATPPNWTLVSKKKANTGSRAGASTKNTSSSPRDKQRNSKEALSRRCTLLQAQKVQANSFSSIQIRNLLNNAFKSKGIQELVISTVSLSFRGNIVVNTTPEFNAEFLFQNEAIIKGVLPLVTSLKKGEPWHKVVIHGIPIREFNTEDGMDLVVEEIRTFNKGLTPIGRPYWATPKEKRDSGLVSTGTIIVAFPTEEQATKAINNRLYIAGISAKVAKYIATSSTAQCNICAGYGHSETLCKRAPKCILCAEEHNMKQHYCLICKKKGEKCSHLSLKCANCKSTTHSANSKLCEVYLAIKNKASSSN